MTDRRDNPPHLPSSSKKSLKTSSNSNRDVFNALESAKLDNGNTLLPPSHSRPRLSNIPAFTMPAQTMTPSQPHNSAQTSLTTPPRGFTPATPPLPPLRINIPPFNPDITALSEEERKIAFLDSIVQFTRKESSKVASYRLQFTTRPTHSARSPHPHATTTQGGSIEVKFNDRKNTFLFAMLKELYKVWDPRESARIATATNNVDSKHGRERTLGKALTPNQQVAAHLRHFLRPIREKLSLGATSAPFAPMTARGQVSTTANHPTLNDPSNPATMQRGKLLGQIQERKTTKATSVPFAISMSPIQPPPRNKHGGDSYQLDLNSQSILSTTNTPPTQVDILTHNNTKSSKVYDMNSDTDTDWPHVNAYSNVSTDQRQDQLTTLQSPIPNVISLLSQSSDDANVHLPPSLVAANSLQLDFVNTSTESMDSIQIFDSLPRKKRPQPPPPAQQQQQQHQHQQHQLHPQVQLNTRPTHHASTSTGKVVDRRKMNSGGWLTIEDPLYDDSQDQDVLLFSPQPLLPSARHHPSTPRSSHHDQSMMDFSNDSDVFLSPQASKTTTSSRMRDETSTDQSESSGDVFASQHPFSPISSQVQQQQQEQSAQQQTQNDHHSQPQHQRTQNSQQLHSSPPNPFLDDSNESTNNEDSTDESVAVNNSFKLTNHSQNTPHVTVSIDTHTISPTTHHLPTILASLLPTLRPFLPLSSHPGHPRPSRLALSRTNPPRLNSAANVNLGTLNCSQIISLSQLALAYAQLTKNYPKVSTLAVISSQPVISIVTARHQQQLHNDKTTLSISLNIKDESILYLPDVEIGVKIYLNAKPIDVEHVFKNVKIGDFISLSHCNFYATEVSNTPHTSVNPSCKGFGAQLSDNPINSTFQTSYQTLSSNHDDSSNFRPTPSFAQSLSTSVKKFALSLNANTASTFFVLNTDKLFDLILPHLSYFSSIYATERVSAKLSQLITNGAIYSQPQSNPFLLGAHNPSYPRQTALSQAQQSNPPVSSHSSSSSSSSYNSTLIEFFPALMYLSIILLQRAHGLSLISTVSDTAVTQLIKSTLPSCKCDSTHSVDKSSSYISSNRLAAQIANGQQKTSANPNTAADSSWTFNYQDRQDVPQYFHHHSDSNPSKSQQTTSPSPRKTHFTSQCSCSCLSSLSSFTGIVNSFDVYPLSSVSTDLAKTSAFSDNLDAPLSNQPDFISHPAVIHSTPRSKPQAQQAQQAPEARCVCQLPHTIGSLNHDRINISHDFFTNLATLTASTNSPTPPDETHAASSNPSLSSQPPPAFDLTHPYISHLFSLLQLRTIIAQFSHLLSNNVSILPCTNFSAHAPSSTAPFTIRREQALMTVSVFSNSFLDLNNKLTPNLLGVKSQILRTHTTSITTPGLEFTFTYDFVERLSELILWYFFLVHDMSSLFDNVVKKALYSATPSYPNPLNHFPHLSQSHFPHPISALGNMSSLLRVAFQTYSTPSLNSSSSNLPPNSTLTATVSPLQRINSIVFASIPTFSHLSTICSTSPAILQTLLWVDSITHTYNLARKPLEIVKAVDPPLSPQQELQTTHSPLPNTPPNLADPSNNPFNIDASIHPHLFNAIHISPPFYPQNSHSPRLTLDDGGDTSNLAGNNTFDDSSHLVQHSTVSSPPTTGGSDKNPFVSQSTSSIISNVTSADSSSVSQPQKPTNHNPLRISTEREVDQRLFESHILPPFPSNQPLSRHSAMTPTSATRLQIPITALSAVIPSLPLLPVLLAQAQRSSAIGDAQNDSNGTPSHGNRPGHKETRTTAQPVELPINNSVNLHPPSTNATSTSIPAKEQLANARREVYAAHGHNINFGLPDNKSKTTQKLFVPTPITHESVDKTTSMMFLHTFKRVLSQQLALGPQQHRNQTRIISNSVRDGQVLKQTRNSKSSSKTGRRNQNGSRTAVKLAQLRNSARTLLSLLGASLSKKNKRTGDEIVPAPPQDAKTQPINDSSRAPHGQHRQCADTIQDRAVTVTKKAKRAQNSKPAHNQVVQLFSTSTPRSDAISANHAISKGYISNSTNAKSLSQQSQPNTQFGPHNPKKRPRQGRLSADGAHRHQLEEIIQDQRESSQRLTQSPIIHPSKPPNTAHLPSALKLNRAGSRYNPNSSQHGVSQIPPHTSSPTQFQQSQAASFTHSTQSDMKTSRERVKTHRLSRGPN